MASWFLIFFSLNILGDCGVNWPLTVLKDFKRFDDFWVLGQHEVYLTSSVYLITLFTQRSIMIMAAEKVCKIHSWKRCNVVVNDLEFCSKKNKCHSRLLALSSRFPLDINTQNWKLNESFVFTTNTFYLQIPNWINYKTGESNMSSFALIAGNQSMQSLSK